MSISAIKSQEKTQQRQCKSCCHCREGNGRCTVIHQMKPAMNALVLLFLCCALTCLQCSTVAAQAKWTLIPKSDPANELLQIIRRSQPLPTDLPENSTYNYIWAQNMMAWMVAERSGLMSSNECCERLSGLLNRVVNWKTYHGFYYDRYDAKTGRPASDNVYFQGWWIWALILTRNSFPCAAGPANVILSRINYNAAGMVSKNHKYLVADRNARTGAMSYYIKPTGDIAGELRTAVICYTWLTGDIKPWQITKSPSFLTIGGEPVLSVWHHFAFDPFYVHSCFPEFGYFQKSYKNLVKGANEYRLRNGMRFYATRMEPLQAWVTKPTIWPNTEYRIAKPWIAWLIDSNAPVMRYAWVPNYGVVQYFDNWKFYWGYGKVTKAHPKIVGGQHHGVFEATFHLDTLPINVATRPPKLTKLILYAKSTEGAGPLIIKVNGVKLASVQKSISLLTPITIIPPHPPVLSSANTIRLETQGTNIWQIGMPPTTYQYVKWRSANQDSSNVSAVALTVFVNGQRADRENPYAFLCRAAGTYSDFPWMLLSSKEGYRFGDRLVAWVGDFSTSVKYAHVIYNVAESAKKVQYILSPWENGKHWVVVLYNNRSKVIPSHRAGNTISWTQRGRQTILLKPAQ